MTTLFNLHIIVESSKENIKNLEERIKVEERNIKPEIVCQKLGVIRT